MTARVALVTGCGKPDGMGRAIARTLAASGVSVVVAAAERYGRLDILVNNAAAPQGLDRHDIEEVPVEVWDQVIRVNLRGTYLMCRFAVPLMRSQRFGRIINISSMAGVVAAPRSTAYSASKAAYSAAAAYLASDGSGYMTGQLLVLDGGGMSPFPVARPEGAP